MTDTKRVKVAKIEDSIEKNKKIIRNLKHKRYEQKTNIDVDISMVKDDIKTDKAKIKEIKTGKKKGNLYGDPIAEIQW